MAEEQTPTPTKGSSGIDPKLASLLSYLLGIIGGIVFFIIEKDDKTVRFHALQSIAFFIAWGAAYFVLQIVAIVIGQVSDCLGAIFGLIAWLGIGIGGLIVWIMLMVKAYNGEKWKLPVIGDIAEKNS